MQQHHFARRRSFDLPDNIDVRVSLPSKTFHTRTKMVTILEIKQMLLEAFTGLWQMLLAALTPLKKDVAQLSDTEDVAQLSDTEDVQVDMEC